MSKTILIIGDSWGVPNYEGPFHGAEPCEHTEYRLRQLGHKVYNCAMNGGSNCRSIDLARRYLKGERTTLEPIYLHNTYHKVNEPEYIDIVNSKIDWVVWFHTEFFRGEFRGEFYKNKHRLLDDITPKLAHLDYKNASDFFKTLDAKIAIIGGQSPVVTDILYEYINPNFLIQDWRSELIGIKLPEVHTHSKVEWVENSSDTIDYKIELLEKHSILASAMRNSEYFTDNCHPGSKAHQELTSILHEVFQNVDSKRA